jgi:hypothetical protein
VPLSEEEQRILNQIERQLNESDPHSARRISEMSLPRYLARNCGLATVGFFAGLALLLAAFAVTWVLGIVGFVIMVISAIALTQNLRKMGRHGWDQFNRNLKSRSASDRFGDPGERFRRRFGGDR